MQHHLTSHRPAGQKCILLDHCSSMPIQPTSEQNSWQWHQWCQKRECHWQRCHTRSERESITRSELNWHNSVEHKSGEFDQNCKQMSKLQCTKKHTLQCQSSKSWPKTCQTNHKSDTNTQTEFECSCSHTLDEFAPLKRAKEECQNLQFWIKLMSNSENLTPSVCHLNWVKDFFESRKQTKVKFFDIFCDRAENLALWSVFQKRLWQIPFEFWKLLRNFWKSRAVPIQNACPVWLQRKKNLQFTFLCWNWHETFLVFCPPQRHPNGSSRAEPNFQFMFMLHFCFGSNNLSLLCTHCVSLMWWLQKLVGVGALHEWCTQKLLIEHAFWSKAFYFSWNTLSVGEVLKSETCWFHFVVHVFCWSLHG